MTSNPSARRSTAIKRSPHKGSEDPAHLEEILRRSFVAHVAIDDSGPVIIPVAAAPSRDRSELLLHGSSASRLFSRLAEGVDACVEMTLLEGLVLARSSYESSMHYKSLVAFGRARGLEGQEKLDALDTLVEHLLPHRLPELRESYEQELKATAIVAFPLDDYTIKVSGSDPKDKPEDISAPIWAGIVPIVESFGEPIPAKNLNPGISLPGYIKEWKRV